MRKVILSILCILISITLASATSIDRVTTDPNIVVFGQPFTLYLHVVDPPANPTVDIQFPNGLYHTGTPIDQYGVTQCTGTISAADQEPTDLNVDIYGSSGQGQTIHLVDVIKFAPFLPDIIFSPANIGENQPFSVIVPYNNTPKQRVTLKITHVDVNGNTITDYSLEKNYIYGSPESYQDAIFSIPSLPKGTYNCIVYIENVSGYPLGTRTLSFNIPTQTQQAHVITVDDDKLDYPNADYSTIQDAVTHAVNGDSIVVYPGTYNENVLVDKQVAIKSNSGNPDNTIISANQGVKVTADSVNISGFKLVGTSTSGTGIYLDGVKGCTITNNKISGYENGIQLHLADTNTLKNNDASNNKIGIHLISSNKNSLEDNNVCNNDASGILLEEEHEISCSSNQIINNVVSYNGYGAISGGSIFNENGISIVSPGSSKLGGTVIKGNTVNNNAYSGIWTGMGDLSQIENNIANNNKYGIYINSEDGCKIKSNTVDSNSEAGIFINSCNYQIEVSDNTVSKNLKGISISRSEIKVHDNNIVNNQIGILLISGKFCQILSNVVYNNNLGISVSDSGNNNWISDNSFKNNINTQDQGSNYWDYNNRGNYYSDYTGIDSNDDGIGDTPYYIPGGNNKDNYPLMKPGYDFEKPIIQSVVLYPANTTPGSKIFVTVSANDNVGVTGVTADTTSLTKDTNGLWQGTITAPSTVGSYSVSINASDAAGNIAQSTAAYSVVLPSGGVNIGVSPRINSVSKSATTTVPLTITVKNTQNVDDIFKVYLDTSGVSAPADLSWFNWKEGEYKVSAGQQITIPVVATVPAITSQKMFYVKVQSELSALKGFTTGYFKPS